MMSFWSFVTTAIVLSFGGHHVHSFSSRPLPRTSRSLPQPSKPEFGAGSQLSLAFGEAWTAYNSALEADPLIVKSVTAALLLGAADLTGQALESKRREARGYETYSFSESTGIDWGRAGRFAIFGLVLQAPWNHFYYLLLDGQIPPTAEPFSPSNLAKVFIDQFIQAPIFTILIFVFLGLLEGKSMESIQNKLNNDYSDTMIANWKLWIPATFINIGFVPPLLRVLYLNVVFFFWCIYLSLQVNKREEV